MKKEKHSVCCQAAAFYCDLITGEQPVPDEMQRHIENCSRCRDDIRRLQEALSAPADPCRPVELGLLRMQLSLFDQWVNCRQILPFLPFLSAGDPFSASPAPVWAHLAHCPACRGDLETLRRFSFTPSQKIQAGRFLSGDDSIDSQIDSVCRQTLAAIRKRPCSSVLTQISRDPSTGRFHVSVADTQTDASKALSACSSVRWMRHGLAAAVVMAAVLFFWRIPSARGLDLEEVYRALSNAINVSIVSYQPQADGNGAVARLAAEKQEPIQQIWISNTLGVQLFIEKDQAVLWDLQRQRKIIRTPAGPQSLPITYPVQKLETPWGLLPIDNRALLPKGYRLRSASPENAELLPNTKIYELTWVDEPPGETRIYRKWRGYLHSQTKLPYRIEWLDKLPGQDFRIMTVALISYPKENRVLAQIAEEGFDYRTADHK